MTLKQEIILDSLGGLEASPHTYRRKEKEALGRGPLVTAGRRVSGMGDPVRVAGLEDGERGRWDRHF